MTWLAVRSALSSVPRWIYIAAAGVLLMLAGGLWHRHQVRAFEARIRAEEDAKFVAIANRIEAQANALSARVAEWRKRNDEEARGISAAAGDLRLRGPGAAICRGSGPAAATGGYYPPDGAADASVDRLPYPAVGELMAVPFGDLVDVAERCDLNRAEAVAWRDWYARVSTEWAKMKADAERPRKER